LKDSIFNQNWLKADKTTKPGSEILRTPHEFQWFCAASNGVFRSLCTACCCALSYAL